MSLHEEDLRQFVTWWTTRLVPFPDDLISEGFSHQWNNLTTSREDILARAAYTAPWSELHFHGVVIAEEQAAAFFEGVDPVTGLRHRVAWLLEHRAGQIHRVLELNSPLP